jgi:hypothetical protein
MSPTALLLGMYEGVKLPQNLQNLRGRPEHYPDSGPISSLEGPVIHQSLAAVSRVNLADAVSFGGSPVLTTSPSEPVCHLPLFNDSEVFIRRRARIIQITV